MKTITFNKTNIKALSWPRGSTHVEIATEDGKHATVAKPQAAKLLDGVTASVVVFGAMVNKKFCALAAQPESAIKEAKPDIKEPKTKEPKTKEERKSVSDLPTIFDHSVTSVCRRLGKEGLTSAQVRGIFAARKIKASPTTIQIQVNAGAKGERGEPASLTQEQIRDLKSDIPKELKAA